MLLNMVAIGKEYFKLRKISTIEKTAMAPNVIDCVNVNQGILREGKNQI
jgi:hypothetical protein